MVTFLFLSCDWYFISVSHTHKTLTTHTYGSISLSDASTSPFWNAMGLPHTRPRLPYPRMKRCPSPRPASSCASKRHQGLVTEPSSTPASVSGLCRLPAQLHLATPQWAACCSPFTITLARAAQKEEPGVLLLPPSSDFWVLFLTSRLSLLDSNDSPSGTAISLFVKRRETYLHSFPIHDPPNWWNCDWPRWSQLFRDT